jgi:hypothetical protein
VGKEDTEHHNTFFSIRDQEQDQEQSHTTTQPQRSLITTAERKQSEARSKQER